MLDVNNKLINEISILMEDIFVVIRNYKIIGKYVDASRLK